MAKDRIQYVCDNCGQETSKWLGKCPACGQWGTMKEFRVKEERPSSAAVRAALQAAGGEEGKRRNFPKRMSHIVAQKEPRIDMQDAELNRVLGGGLVPGSLVLLGGEPGIGKSTLVLQTVLQLARTRRVLYVSGEESERQIKLRAERLSSMNNEPLSMNNEQVTINNGSVVDDAQA